MSASAAYTIVEPRSGLGASCRSLLAELPGWFGIPEANEDYIRFVDDHLTWSAVDPAGRVIALLAPQMHAQSAEIHLLAVAPEWHRRGVGRALVAAFEEAAGGTVPLAQVKTPGPSDPDEGYANTRRFYEALGYLQLEEMLTLWPGNPALVMVKLLDGTHREAAVIGRSSAPVTGAAIRTALRAAGVSSGACVIVHSSLSRIGWVVGGAHTVVNALLDAVGTGGTVTMPSLSSDLSEPARWVSPPVPEAWWPVIRDEVPAFDPHLTPTTHMGAVVECFRHLPTVARSEHPADSFVAHGPLAEHVVHPHPLSPAFGDGSPLSRLYDLDARIVLLGVGHSNNTSLHLAECRAAQGSMPATTVTYGAPVMRDGVRQWVEFDDLDYDPDDFPALGAAFEAAGGEVTRAPLGVGEVTSCSMREIVDFGVSWLRANRVAI